MAIRRAPLKTDAAGKCSRWWVRVYDRNNHKHGDRHTVIGTLQEAKALERQLQEKLGAGTYLTRKERKTVKEVYDMWFGELNARGRRASTLADYTSSLTLYVLPDFGPREVGSLRKAELRTHFNAMIKRESSSKTNKAIRAFKALLNFAHDVQLLDRNPLSRFKQYPRKEGEPRANRGVFTEAEVRAILEAATPRERALIGVLFGTGVRPGEAYALDWQSVDLEAGRIAVRRSSCYRSGKFVAPKTEAGNRLVPASPLVVGLLRAYRATSSAAPEDLVFPSEAGTPFNPSNVRRDIWLPLKARANVRNLDLYSLRHTFVTYCRATGAEAFNVSRAIGHAKSTIVDSVYANHTLDSGIAPLSAMVTDRVFGTAPSSSPPPGTPGAPAPGRGRPKLRIIGGGKA